MTNEIANEEKKENKLVRILITLLWLVISVGVDIIAIVTEEAIVGAILARENSKNKDNIKQLTKFRGLDVIDVIKNPNLVCV